MVVGAAAWLAMAAPRSPRGKVAEDGNATSTRGAKSASEGRASDDEPMHLPLSQDRNTISGCGSRNAEQRASSQGPADPADLGAGKAAEGGGAAARKPGAGTGDDTGKKPTLKDAVGLFHRPAPAVACPEVPRWTPSTSSGANRKALLTKKRITVTGNSAHQEEVTLHVYDIVWLTRLSQMAGQPAFHLSIEVHNREHCFGSGGIFTGRLSHKRAFKTVGDTRGHYVHQKAISVGHTSLSARDVRILVGDMKKEWSGNSYSIFGRNCQTFAVAFCAKLGLEGSIPTQYIRFSDFLGGFSLNFGGQDGEWGQNLFGWCDAATATSTGSVAWPQALTPRLDRLCCVDKHTSQDVETELRTAEPHLARAPSSEAGPWVWSEGGCGLEWSSPGTAASWMRSGLCTAPVHGEPALCATK